MKNPDQTIPDLKVVKTSTYEIKCPYCQKPLKAQYIKQVNQHYKAHVETCKENKQ